MPRYFFNTVDGARVRDTAGIKLVDRQAARTRAIQFAGRLLADEPDYLCDGRNFRVEVTDEDGRLVFTIITTAVDTQEAETSNK